MGILEYWGVHLHPLCWDPQEPGSSHIQGQICQPRPVDTGTDPGEGWDNTLRVFFLNKPSQDSPKKMREVEEEEEFQLG